ncbi:GYDIA family GHMP kinase [Blattabacterium cuenoti]|uniref:GYDIA family GHMP kinase n=1 Tax=Blattabacterium cuenoti TaxID=1653831 RepID=UPI00163C002D|nr:GYDIA family GHMP kinase [Blattabacterium cuenoti]
MKCKTDNFFYSHGKLLLTGEYIILYGASGFALPTVKGQSLSFFYDKKNIKPNLSRFLYWKSFDHIDQLWFESIFQLPSLNIYSETKKKTSIVLRNLLLESKKINKNFLPFENGLLYNIYVKTKLEFPINWGLGSSSTLINNIAMWANINPYMLLDKIFTGSGYDVACGSHSKPIIFRRKLKDKKPHIISVDFNPNFKKKLFFLHLNKKQNTNESVKYFRSIKNISVKKIELISSITKKIPFCKNLNEFEELLFLHEKIMSNILNIPTIKELYFPDYLGLVKSLGSWGGDFVLISFRYGMKKYFSKKGFHTIFSFDEMIL